MARRICDRSPCAPLVVLLDLYGQLVDDKVQVEVHRAPKKNQVELRYCPFCGTRVGEEAIARLKRRT